MFSHVWPGSTRCQLLQYSGWPACVLVGGHAVSMLGWTMVWLVMGWRIE
jgi:hypothetical protein